MKKNRLIIGMLLVVFMGAFVLTQTAAAARFINNGDGTITDTQTNLMWAAQDNGSAINWYDAESYCKSFNKGGHSQWRMPTIAETQALHAGGAHANIIKLSDCCVWTSGSSATNAGSFNFVYGVTNYIPRWSVNDGARALPVRNR